jgi:2-keto-4-pentenoate hydratase/2-oxohepta-3-ene-1,7-dioic acid hydratase in catechol pathway
LIHIFCIEQNYFLHKREHHNEISGEPEIFLKPESALLKTGKGFQYPGFANELYCGCELVLRISKSGKDIQENIAGNYYDAITAGINFTALDNRDLSDEKELTWEKAKAWDNSSVAGKWMPVTDFKDKKDINFCLYKNRELVQVGNSGLMINNFDTIISGISSTFPINSGDLIFTGNPAGIGKLMAGDKLEAFIEDDSLLEFEIG